MNKKLLPTLCATLLLLAMLPLTAGSVVAATGPVPVNAIPKKPTGLAIYITDLADMIDADDRAALQNYLQGLDQQNIAQIAILTLPDSRRELSLFAHQIFNDWGIGHSKRNDGILILVNARRVKANLSGNRIYVAIGYGLEGILPDGLVGNILDTRALPAFAQKDYSEGIRLTAMALGKIAAGAQALAETFANTSSFELGLSEAVFIFFFIILILFVIWLINRGGGGGPGSDVGRYDAVGSFRSERGYGGSDSGSSGGFGGDFGGGRSGGGGAGR